ncbi:MAG: outer membrane protein assembly factor BamE [Hydrogenophilus sp.]|nr:outer membrane protein assembly factor BamE [Hydrogenophilus sp.]
MKRVWLVRLLGMGAGGAILNGCALDPGGVFDRVAAIASPYAAPVRQGNWVDPELIAKLSPGMSKDEVRKLLGAPLLVDPFRDNRWDYLYRFDNRRGVIEDRRLTLFFAEGRLIRVEHEGWVPHASVLEGKEHSPRGIQVIEIAPRKGEGG